MSKPRGAPLAHFADRIEPKDDERPLQLGLIKRLFEYTENCRWQRNWLFVLVAIRALQMPLIAWCLGAVIKGPIAQGDAAGLVWGCVGFGLLALSADVVFHFRQRYALELGEQVVHDLRADLFAHLLRLPVGFFQSSSVGRLISRMTSDIESVRKGVQDALFVTVVQGGQMLFAAVFMIYYNWRLFCVILAMAPLLWWLNGYFRAKLSYQARVTQESFSRVTSTLAETVSGIQVTQGFSRESVNYGFFRSLCAAHGEYNWNLARTSSLLAPILELNSQFFVAALVTLGGYFAIEGGGAAQVGDLIMFLFLSNLFFSPMSSIALQYNQALVAMAGAERVFGLIDMPAESGEDDAAAEKELAGGVEFRDVTFGYNAEQLALDRVTLRIEPGQSVALVGATGSGKSTLASLLARFYSPSSGAVLLDGVDIRMIKTRSLRAQIGIALQQNFLFSGTAMDNIRFARPEATDEEVREAARGIGCLDVIEGLPQGFATEVGERGSSLSLGERQVVCFARAMLADPKILILDEATSALDPILEAKLQRALERLLVGRTSLIVAHRLSVVRRADTIVVLEGGRIVEQGPHDALLARGGAYAKLYRRYAQAMQGAE